MKPADPQTRFLSSTTDKEHFKKIFAMIPMMENVPYSQKEFLVWWIKNYNEQYFRVWIETDESEKEVFSFMIAQIVRPMIDDEILILLTYVNPKSDVCQSLLDRVVGWARVQGIKRISAYVYRSPEGFCEKYKFQKGYTEIYKDLAY